MICPLCGAAPNNDTGLCAFHAPIDDWAAENRIMCDAIHRRVLPPRLPASEREEIA